MGSSLWEEALNDMVQETCLDIVADIPTKWYMWKVFKRAPEPENKDEVLSTIREKVLKGVNYIQSIADKGGKKFITGDKVCSISF